MKQNKKEKTLSFNSASGVHNFNTSGGLGIGTTTSSTLNIQYSKKVESVQFIENTEGNFIEITYSVESNYNNCTITYVIPPTGKSMLKEIYGVVNGKMQLIKTITGTERAGYYVGPTVEWDE